MYYLLMWGVIFHASLLFFGNLMGATTLFEMAEMLSDSNFIVAGLCWIPSLLYLAFCICYLVKAEGWEETLAFAAAFIIGLPVVCAFLGASVWALLILVALGGLLIFLVGPLMAALLVFLIPGLVTVTCTLLAIGVCAAVVSVLSAIVGSSFLLSAIFCVLIAGLIAWFLIVRPVRALIQRRSGSSKFSALASVITLVCACVGIFIGLRTILFDFMVFF
ncbi:MAG: hypothetical protein LUH09_07820 [Clostridiales bacterium]|nr:hypothetical protein [Clostridiales bacterium]